MVSFKPIIIPGNRRSDGTWAVNIRVTFRGKSRRLATTLVCTERDLTRTGKIKNATILERAEELIKRMRSALEGVTPFELEDRDVDYVVRRIKESLAGETFRLDLFEWADRYLKGKSPSTRRAYTGALNAMERYLGKRRLDVNDISRAMLLDFMDHVDKERKVHFDPGTGEWKEGKAEKVPKGASSRHVAKLANIYNAAKDRYNDEDEGRILIPRSPFDKVKKVIPPSQGQKALSQDAFQALINCTTSDENVRTAVDLFVVSFCLMGANLVDLWQASPPVGGVWEYSRQKTRTRRADGARMRVTVPAEAAPFLARLTGKSSSVWLPVLRRWAGSPDGATRKANKCLRRWARAEGVPEFTFYAARHTWATFARRAGVEKATIDECLAHVGDFAITDIYAERSWELMAAANRKVLDLFTWR